MNEGVIRSSHMVAAGAPNWWSTTTNTTTTTRAPPPHHPNHSFLAAAPPPQNLFPPLSTSWNHDSQELPQSCYQLLLGGSVGEEEKLSDMQQHQSKKLENWEHNFLNHSSITSCGINGDDEEDHHVNQQENLQKNSYLQALEPIISASWPYNHFSHHQQIVSNDTSSPKSSCVSTTLSTNNNMLDFSHKFSSDPNSSHECNSGGSTGPVAKKPKINQASSAQSTFKVRKEKLGDRITALHQLVSPFGKTDTASVLLEAIGYIRFLHNQVEALSMPYLGNDGSRNTGQHQNVQGDHTQSQRNCLFPEDPGQLLNEKCVKRKNQCEQESNVGPEDLRSRGLCLVPVSCTLQVGNETAADYWAPAFGGNF